MACAATSLVPIPQHFVLPDREELVDKIYELFAEKIKELGLSESQTQKILEAKKITYDPTPKGRFSIFQTPILAGIDESLKPHIIKILNHSKAGSDITFLTALHCKTLDSLNLLIDSLPKDQALKRIREDFLEYVLGFFVWYDFKIQVNGFVKNHPSSVLELVKILKCEEFSITPEFFLQQIEKWKESITLVDSEHKKEVLLDFTLFESILSQKDLLPAIEMGYCMILLAFRECTQTATSLLDFTSLANFYKSILDHLLSRRQTRLSRSILPLSSEVFLVTFKELHSLFKDLKEKERVTSKGLHEGFFKKVYTLITQHMIKTSLEYAEHACELDKAMVSIVKQGMKATAILRNSIAMGLGRLSFEIYFNRFLYPLLRVLNVRHQYGFDAIFNRAFFLTIVTALSKQEIQLDPSKRLSLHFKEEFEAAKKIKFLNLDEVNKRGYLSNLLIGHFDEISLPDLEKRINGEQVEPTLDTRVAAISHDITSHKQLSFLSVKFWALNNFLEAFDFENFEFLLRSLHKNILKKVRALPKEVDLKEVQSFLRDELFKIFQPQLYEFILFRDLEVVLHAKRSSSLLFPDLLLNLLFLEIPGVVQTEEPLLAVPEVLVEEIPKKKVEQIEEELDLREAQEEKRSPFLLFETKKEPEENSITPLCEQKKPPRVERKTEAGSQDPTLQDFLQARKPRQIHALLRRMHFELIRHNRHAIFSRGESAEVVVPEHRELKVGTIRSIYRQAQGHEDS